jgi:hypothetical protein
MTLSEAKERRIYILRIIQESQLKRPLHEGYRPVWFVVIGGPKKLGLLARKLPTYGLGDPHNTRVKGLAGLRAIVVGRARLVVMFFLRQLAALGLR